MSPISTSSPAADTLASRLRSGRANIRQAYDLAVTGGLGALFGLYLYVEMVQAESVYVRDALAGLLIGGSLGFFLNAYGPVRDGAWQKLARSVAWGARLRPWAVRSGWSPARSSSACSEADCWVGRCRGPCWDWGSGSVRAWPTDPATA